MYCQNCRFFAVADTHQRDSGQCRRYPPTIPNTPNSEDAHLVPRTGVWPMVSSGAWCGEYQAGAQKTES